MTGLDTNAILRFLVNDEKLQADIVKNIFLEAEKTEKTFYISNPVILELLYVLDSVYGYSRKSILNAIESLLSLSILYFESPDSLQSMIEYEKTNIELTDLFIGLLSKEAGCDKTITFDKKAAKSDLFELLK